jgi:hypothetical protein
MNEVSTIFPEKNVLRLQVSVKDLLRMQMTQSKSDLSHEEPCLFLLESLDLDQMSEQLSSSVNHD